MELSLYSFMDLNINILLFYGISIYNFMDLVFTVLWTSSFTVLWTSALQFYGPQ